MSTPGPNSAKHDLGPEKASIEHRDSSQSASGDATSTHYSTPRRHSTENINAKLANPLANISHDQLIADAETFARSHQLGHLTEIFQKGALVAQNPTEFESLPLLNDEDKVALRREVTHKWDQPVMMYYLVILCSVAAAVQGSSNSQL